MLVLPPHSSIFIADVVTSHPFPSVGIVRPYYSIMTTGTTPQPSTIGGVWNQCLSSYPNFPPRFLPDRSFLLLPPRISARLRLTTGWISTRIHTATDGLFTTKTSNATFYAPRTSASTASRPTTIHGDMLITELTALSLRCCLVKTAFLSPRRAKLHSSSHGSSS